ncbi:heme ABC transporter ATP-binding protein/permease CydC [Ferrimonas marina]|uniref:Glutathione/L-cysteine transport system ATP-binding/permease protein CydC n=1 Tax=Ferrimonas marina TaxID=299255 RepID=A0A1M5N4S3_9GAMM|nr:cysteine/glutathione ABC transporter ATP-binding protein/permease CydC [Ferrimonas marina]SHG84179.1 ATP-binding cassette, subfamily C, CydC [Ferrimonas marina]
MRDLLPFLKLYRQHWGRLSAGTLLALLTLIASIGLLSLSGWFIAASAVAGLVIARSADFNYMMPAGGVRAFSLTRTVSRWAERVVSHDATFRLLATLRSWFFRRLGPLTPTQLQGLRQGDLLNRMVSDVDALDHLYLRLVTPMVAGALAILMVSALFYFIDPTLGLVLAAVLLTLLLLLPPLFYRLGQQPGEQLGRAQGALRLSLLEYIEGQTELLVFDAEAQKREEIRQREQQLVKQQGRMASLTGFSQGLMVTLNGWLLLGMLVLASQLISLDSGPLLALVAFATLASFEALSPVTNAFQHLSHCLGAARRLNPILQAKPEQADGEAAVPALSTLDIEDVHYRYPGALDSVLNGTSLQIQAGEKVALLGKTGCGKSTLLQLICGEAQPQQGSLSWNGAALPTLLASELRQRFCLVSQRVHVFNDSLANNLRLAAPEADDGQLVWALQQVKLDALLKGDGLNQWLGEGGRQLSGGERRRLGIARALLHPADLVLLDEPTEGLDDATEQEVIAALMAQTGRAMLYVTHKRAALAQMDRVYQMEAGRLSPA